MAKRKKTVAQAFVDDELNGIIYKGWLDRLSPKDILDDCKPYDRSITTRKIKKHYKELDKLFSTDFLKSVLRHLGKDKS